MRKRDKFGFWLGLALILLAGSSAWAFELLVPDFKVDQDTSYFKSWGPVVAVGGNCNIIFGWVDTLQGAIYARRFDPRGNPLGDVFRVDFGAPAPGSPSVITDGSNNFIFAWDALELHYGTQIYARRYDAGGNPSGDPFRVDQGGGLGTGIALDSNNNLVFTWCAACKWDSWSLCNFARRFDSAGDPIGDAFRLSELDPNDLESELDAHIVFDQNNNLIAVWTYYNYDLIEDSLQAYARILDANGNPLGPAFRIDQPGPLWTYADAIAIDSNNNWIVGLTEGTGYDETYPLSADYHVYVRRFDSKGTPLGDEFQVDQSTPPPPLLVSPHLHDLVVDGKDRFLVLWAREEASSIHSYARLYDSAGNPLTEEFRVNASSQASASSVAVDKKHSNFVFTWEGGWANIWGEDGDHDGLPNDWEKTYSCLQANTVDHLADPDSDELTNESEYASGTDPCAADTDQDGLSDGEEVLIYGTNPLIPDTELDGMPDGWEVIFPCLSALVADSSSDADGDGLTNLAEFQHLTDPCRQDTDQDALNDGEEVQIYLTDPLLRDTDGDGYSDGEEVYGGTDPLDPASFPKEKIVSTDWSYPDGSSSACGQLAGSSPSGLLIFVSILAFGLIRFWRNFSRDQ